MLTRIGLRWRPALTGFRKHQMFHQSTSVLDKETVEKHEVPCTTTTRNDNDSMVTAIKLSKNSYELLNVLSKNARNFSAEETMTALKALFELQKHTK